MKKLIVTSSAKFQYLRAMRCAPMRHRGKLVGKLFANVAVAQKLLPWQHWCSCRHWVEGCNGKPVYCTVGIKSRSNWKTPVEEANQSIVGNLFTYYVLPRTSDLQLLLLLRLLLSIYAYAACRCAMQSLRHPCHSLASWRARVTASTFQLARDLSQITVKFWSTNSYVEFRKARNCNMQLA